MKTNGLVKYIWHFLSFFIFHFNLFFFYFIASFVLLAFFLLIEDFFLFLNMITFCSRSIPLFRVKASNFPRK